MSAAGPTSTAGQAIQGALTERATGFPVAGAMVRVMRTGDPTGHRFLTAGDGRYRILLDEPGTYHLEVERIGFERVLAGPIAVEGIASVVFDIAVAAAPVRIEGLSVEAVGGRCSRDFVGAGRTQAIWDEARKALAASSWTESDAQLVFEVDRRVRRLDARSETVLEESHEVTRGTGSNSVRTLAPSDLAEGGYVRDEGGYLYYFGPDADVLLSDAFLASHCFGVDEGADEPGLVGLTFEPVPGRDTTDIRGTIWLDSATLRLDGVDFAYTGLRLPGRDLARGEVHFLELPDGRWVVESWLIRTPVLEVRRAAGSPPGAADRVMMTGVQEFASNVLSVEGADGLAWRSGPVTGSLRGLAWNDIDDRPLAEARVFLAGGRWQVETGADGRWSLDGIPAGTYRLGFEHPLLRSLDFEPPWQSVTVTPDSSAFVTVGVPPLTEVLASRCRDASAGRIVGLVLDDANEPMPGVSVIVVDGLPAARGSARDTTDSNGAYRLCGLPREGDFTIAAYVGPLSASGVRTNTRAEGPVRLDLRMRGTGDEPGGDDDRSSREIVRGVTLEAATRRSLAGVLVELMDAGGTVVSAQLTDASGRFLLDPAGVEPFTIRATHLAYAPSESEPLEKITGEFPLEIRMSPEPIPLEEVVVEVRGTVRALDRNGFYRRERMGLGTYLDRVAIEALTPTRMTDVLARSPLMTRMPTSGAVAGVGPVYLFRRAQRLWGDCPPVLYIDGAIVRSGGRPTPSMNTLVTPEATEAIELYSSAATVPAQFTGPGSNCGVVLIWTRAGVGG